MMTNSKAKNLLYLLPYVLLLLLGSWYRAHMTCAYLNGDSCSYLLPPYCKALTGEWHKDFRPMQYLLFIYATLSGTYGLKYTVVVQQALSVLGGAFLAGAWLIFIQGLKNRTFLWHLAGYVMLGTYISSPVIMQYASTIGPESPCISVMCALIFCLAGVFATGMRPAMRAIFIASAVYLNLYLANPMPKCVFDMVFLTGILIIATLREPLLTRRTKALAWMIPLALYLVTVTLPEYTHKTDRKSDDRIYIEFAQAAYTHFDLLARDKTNFTVSPELQDKLVQCYHDAQKGNEHSLLGFNSDNLMWGEANNAINQYFHNNEDSLAVFYKHLDKVLVTKYPLAFAKAVGREVVAFYFSTGYVRKDMYRDQGGHMLYEITKMNALQTDSSFSDLLTFRCTHKALPHRFDIFSAPYQVSEAQAGAIDISQMPLLFGSHFFLYVYFDYLFIIAMLLFFVIHFWRGRGFSLHIISLLYALMAIYVVTIAIVHTFGVPRFITTIYPFILITTFMAMVYTADEVGTMLSGRD